MNITYDVTYTVKVIGTLSKYRNDLYLGPKAELGSLHGPYLHMSGLSERTEAREAAWSLLLEHRGTGERARWNGEVEVHDVYIVTTFTEKVILHPTKHKQPSDTVTKEGEQNK